MSSNVVIIQSGQCGNQIGYEIINQLSRLLLNEKSINNDNTIDMFFRTSLKSNRVYSRSISIDTEPKVINQCLTNSKQSKLWQIDPRSIVYRHGGAGNNWALGYQMCSNDFLDKSIDLIRREIELCDLPPVLLSIHSMAGGTGSGVGAKMTEQINDEFSSITQSNLSILPYHFGEVVVQNYNALLSLSKIYESSNGIIIFENEIAQDLCKRTKSIERPTLLDINHTIASNIIPILLPKYNNNNKLISFHNDIEFLCSHPGYKLLDIKTTPQTSEESISFTYDNWFTLIRSLLRMQILGTYSEIGMSRMLSNHTDKSPNKNIIMNQSKDSVISLGSILTIRGDNANEGVDSNYNLINDSIVIDNNNTSTNIIKQRQQLINNESYQLPNHNYSSHVSSYDSPVRFYYNNDISIANNYHRSASLLSNNQSALTWLNKSYSKASELFQAKAYIHQYDKYGCQ